MTRLLGALGTLPLVLLWLTGIVKGEPIFEYSFFLLIALLFLSWLFASKSRLEGLSRTTFLLSSLSIALTIGDLVLRIFFSDLIYERNHEIFIRMLPDRPELRRYVPSTTARREVVGDLGALDSRIEVRQARMEEFESDSFGFRNRPGKLKPPYNLLVLGDSVAAGSGSTQDESFGALLSSRFGYNVYNLSIPAAGPVQEFLNLRREFGRLKLSPDATVLLALFPSNDLVDSFEGITEISQKEEGTSLDQLGVVLADFRRRSAVSRLLWRFVANFQGASPQIIDRELANGRHMLFFRPYEVSAELERDEVGEDSRWPNFREAIGEIARFCGEKHLKLKVVLLPSKEEIYHWVIKQKAPFSLTYRPSGINESILDLCRERALDCYDPGAEIFDEARRYFNEKGGYLWWFDDTHPNPPGHEVLAHLIDRFLRSSAPEIH
jgi:hypothetical protein